MPDSTAATLRDTIASEIALAYEGCGEAWTDTESGDRLASVAADEAMATVLAWLRGHARKAKGNAFAEGTIRTLIEEAERG